MIERGDLIALFLAGAVLLVCGVVSFIFPEAAAIALAAGWAFWILIVIRSLFGPMRESRARRYKNERWYD